MTETFRLRAIMVGSYILYLIGHLDQIDKTKGSVINLRQLLFSKVSKEDRSLSKLADIAWNEVASEMPKNNVYSIGVAIESLYFAFEKELKGYFGENISDIITRATIKLPNDDRGTKPSYKLVDALKSSVHKVVYNHLQTS